MTCGGFVVIKGKEKLLGLGSSALFEHTCTPHVVWVHNLLYYHCCHVYTWWHNVGNSSKNESTRPRCQKHVSSLEARAASRWRVTSSCIQGNLPYAHFLDPKVLLVCAYDWCGPIKNRWNFAPILCRSDKVRFIKSIVLVNTSSWMQPFISSKHICCSCTGWQTSSR